MRPHAMGWTTRAGHGVWLSGAVLLLMAANDDNGCAPEPAASGARSTCERASDCSGDPGVDCTGDWACQQGQCVFECGPTPVAGCYSDADCGDGKTCNAAEVCRQPPECDSGEACDAVCYGECVDREPQPQPLCTGSEQCARGEYCTIEDGVCLSNCPEGMSCPAMCWGECKPRTTQAVCYGDEQCAFGEFCDRDPCVFPDSAGAADEAGVACGGVCALKEGCRSNDDCAPGQVCGCGPYPYDAPENGLIPCFMQCLDQNGACTSDMECKPGTICQNGMCVEVQRECQSNQECPLGWQCQAQCNAAGDPMPGGEGSGGAEAPIYCPSYCVPPTGETCGDTGIVCGPNQVCQAECWVVCADCDCAEGEDCACPCWEECKAACVVVDPPRDCWSDYECGDGYYCQPSNDCATPAEPPCDPSSGEDCAGRPAPPPCPGTCQPKEQPGYDCKADSDCISADGTQGFCKIQWCEAWAVPCSSDDPNCGAPPPEACYGWCVYDSPTRCDPAADTCPAGTHCEAVSNCNRPGDDPSFMPCLAEYQCVPDVQACSSDCDCDPALACNEGVCMRMGRINTCGLTECTADDQCREGEYCAIDYTQPVCDCAGCPCSIPRGTCQPEIRKCGSDADCGDGEYCGCGQDPSCPMCDVCFFQCMPKPVDTSCDSDADCAAGQTCTFYYPPCAPPPDDQFVPPDYCQPIGVCEDKPASSACVVTGCSGQICAAEHMASTCEWFDHYECYKLAICDLDPNGQCGWQKTDAFVECMARYGQP